MKPGWGWLSEALEVPFVVVDTKRTIKHINELAVVLFVTQLRKSKDIIGQPLSLLTNDRVLDQLVKQALRDTKAGPVSIMVRNGSERTYSVRAVCSGSERNNLVALFFDDLTDIAYLRTVRTDFVANVSHELRTPLSSIRALAETMYLGYATDSETMTRFTGTIIGEVDRLVRLSDDLLLLTRAESTMRHKTYFDLRFCVHDVFERLESTAERRNIRYVLDQAESPVNVFADVSEMDQVAFNLIDNSLKYTNAGGIVSIRCCVVNDKAVLTVEDSGIGILLEDVERIFERFWRADRARKMINDSGNTTSGTGLGLAIVKHIVEAHLGELEVQSELGVGSVFKVSLPISEADRDAVQSDTLL